MIVLDTNVVSETFRPNPEPMVLDWLDRQNIETLFLSAISLAELRYGVSALPQGERKDGLSKALEDRIMGWFAGRILDFDESAASAYATIRAYARRVGKAIGATDGHAGRQGAFSSLEVINLSRTTLGFGGTCGGCFWGLG